MNNERDLDGRLDRAIDRAVREIMSVEPPAGLRRRVIDRLDGRTPAGRGSLRWRPAVYGAAAVAVLTFMIVWRDTPVQTPRETHTTAQAPPPAVPERAAPVTPPIATPPAPGTEGPRAAAGRFRPSRERIAMPPVANVFGAPTERVAATNVDAPTEAPGFGETNLSSDLTIAPLAPPPPIVVPRLTTAPLVMPRIEIPPIEVRRIQTAPATPPR